MRHAIRLSATIAIVALAGAGAARAASFQQRDPEFAARDYTCRVDGENAPLGSRRCLSTPQGRRAAECVIAINMSSWRTVADACP